jgi:hypothetical protein
MKPSQKTNASTAGSESDATETNAPRTLTFAENAILTFKVLAAAALLFAAIWGLSHWTSAR